ncbi:MAG: hypothetical protein O3A36_02790 [bacterium]|nr:hypothetical protein [bacterium]
MKRFLLVTLVLALAVIGAVYFAPLDSKEVRIVKLIGAPEALVLEKNSHIKQRAHLSNGIYSDIIIFADAAQLGQRDLRITIRDTRGNIVARGKTNYVSYPQTSEEIKITIPISWLIVRHDAFFVLDLELVHGESLPIRTIFHDDTTKPAMLVYSFVKRVSIPPLERHGILIGVAFLLAVALLSRIKNQRQKYWAAIILIIFFAPLAVLGYWYSTGDLGIADWDFYFTLHDSYRKAILEHHTFPFWNPYICGGTAGLADPEFPVFSPTFLLELLFGIPVGIRLAITLSVIVGATGMLALARSLGRSVEAGLIAALAVAFGTVSLLEITEGHVNVLAAMWIPWILWAWLGAYRGIRKPVVCGMFLAAAFLGGGIYLLMYTTFAFVFLILFVREHRKAVWKTAQSGLWALGFVSVKLVPVLLWLKQFPDDAYATSAYTLSWIGEILFGRHIHGAYIIFQQNHGWHEYGAYIGYVVFALALVGVSRIRKNRIVTALVISSVVVTFVSALGPYLVPIFDPLWFFPRSNISRVILFAIIPLSLLAAFGADKVATVFPNKGKAIRALLVGIVAIDIISLTYQLSEQAFILPHVVPSISPAPKPIAFTPDRYDEQGQGSRTTRSYDAYKAGYGTFAYCSVLGPTPGVQMVHEEEYTGVVSAVDQRARVTLISWSYNVVRARVETPVATLVVLNTNHVDGWTANGKKTTVFSNRVGIDMAQGNHVIEFRYNPPGFIVGFVISVCTILIALFVRTRYH